MSVIVGSWVGLKWKASKEIFLHDYFTEWGICVLRINALFLRSAFNDVSFSINPKCEQIEQKIESPQTSDKKELFVSSYNIIYVGSQYGRQPWKQYRQKGNGRRKYIRFIAYI